MCACVVLSLEPSYWLIFRGKKEDHFGAKTEETKPTRKRGKKKKKKSEEGKKKEIIKRETNQSNQQNKTGWEVETCSKRKEREATWWNGFGATVDFD